MVGVWQRVFEYFLPLKNELTAAAEYVLLRFGRHSTRFRIAYQLECTQRPANSLDSQYSGFSLYHSCGFPPRSSDVRSNSSRYTQV